MAKPRKGKNKPKAGGSLTSPSTPDSPAGTSAYALGGSASSQFDATARSTAPFSVQAPFPVVPKTASLEVCGCPPRCAMRVCSHLAAFPTQSPTSDLCVLRTRCPLHLGIILRHHTHHVPRIITYTRSFSLFSLFSSSFSVR